MGDPHYNISALKWPKGKHGVKCIWSITKCRWLAKIIKDFASLESVQNRETKSKCMEKADGNWEKQLSMI